MRTRAVAVIALLSLPCALSAQILRPRPSTRTPAEPASLPPTAGEIARTLAYKRARWSFEAYTQFTSMALPSPSGATLSKRPPARERTPTIASRIASPEPRT